MPFYPCCQRPVWPQHQTTSHALSLKASNLGLHQEGRCSMSWGWMHEATSLAILCSSHKSGLAWHANLRLLVAPGLVPHFVRSMNLALDPGSYNKPTPWEKQVAFSSHACAQYVIVTGCATSHGRNQHGHSQQCDNQHGHSQHGHSSGVPEATIVTSNMFTTHMVTTNMVPANIFS